MTTFPALAAAGARQRLIIGPWTHTYDSGRQVGEVDFGPTAEFDYVALMVRWFDHWLKGVNHWIMADPPLRLFVMGENVWREEWEWPLARTPRQETAVESWSRRRLGLAKSSWAARSSPIPT